MRQNNIGEVLSIFMFFLLINLISSGGHLDAWDGLEAFLVTESMVLKSSAKLHPDVPSIRALNFPIQDSVQFNRDLQNRTDLYVSPPENKGFSVLKGNVTLSPYTPISKGVNYIESKFRTINDNNKTDNHAGIVWYDGAKQYYAYLRPNALAVFTPDRGEMASAPLIREIGKPYTLKVIYLNNSINVLLDDIPRVQLSNISTNNSLSISNVGIRSYDSIAEFEPVTVGTLSNQSLQSRNSSVLPELPLTSAKVLYFSKFAQNAPLLEPLFTVRSLLLSAIAVPFYYIATFQISPIPAVAILVNSILISLIAVVIFCFSVHMYSSKRIAFILCLVFAVCSFVWPYNTSLLPQPLQALCIIFSAFLLYRSAGKSTNRKTIYFPGLAGLVLGISLLAHPTSAIFIPAFVGYAIFSIRTKRRLLSSFFLTLTVTLIMVGLVNYLRFGSITEFGYGYLGSISNHNGWAGLLGLVTSPGVGIIFFFPVVILFPLALYYSYKKNRSFSILSTYIFIISWIFFGTTSFNPPAPHLDPSLWTGNGWGPRYMLPTLPFITIVLGELLLHSNRILKISIIGLCIAGFCVNLLGTLVWYQYGYYYGLIEEKLGYYNVHYNQTKKGALGVMTWTPEYSPIILHMKILASDYFSNIPSDYLTGIKTAWPHALAPCSYDIFLYCKFGIVPIIILGILAIFLGLHIVGARFRFRYIMSVIRRSKRMGNSTTRMRS